MSKTVLLILGGSGDLTKRKLIPALSSIQSKKLLPDELVVIGSGRTDYTHDTYREHVETTKELCDCLYYHVGLDNIKEYINSFGDIGKIVVFFSLPPSVYAKSVQELYKQGLVGNNVSLIIEKPFGRDLESSKELEKDILKFYPKESIFLIDHYLAKEPVQNILIFRFANRIFEPNWNRFHIESIQINCSESIGIEDRAKYFDQSGMIRDMIQSHLLQLLTILTMETPKSSSASDIVAEKIKLLKKLKVKNVIRGQYEGYRDEKGVDPKSNTETFAQVEFRIDSDRWYNVPIYITTGKALKRRGTEIGVVFRDADTPIFENDNLKKNAIVFTVQPQSGIIVDLVNKIPGWGVSLTNTNMSFCYSNQFSNNIPDAYQRLLVDAIKGDKTLFVGIEETGEAWRVIEPALSESELIYYKKGEDPIETLIEDPLDFTKYINIC
ncbi:glucose-6-phosphate dehydrogenase [Thiospirochaeta perfilievii]|uniref:Glucose-6-phosphate 1-dehydrogenase n=1 Tax=Thiospirochaeta perfilievii TaxID=252967 RepID=A0A5C1Q695_9SPIO|nr:glucose-6-phosphate dehydrogenase [Thiospirochaeta perfilievii]QEN03495.1 glucose-6-phosphate dehydrogenase [Thiospirochaeta perfilievii]